MFTTQRLESDFTDSNLTVVLVLAVKSSNINWCATLSSGHSRGHKQLSYNRWLNKIQPKNIYKSLFYIILFLHTYLQPSSFFWRKLFETQVKALSQFVFSCYKPLLSWSWQWRYCLCSSFSWSESTLELLMVQVSTSIKQFQSGFSSSIYLINRNVL